jgi:manganese/zinc/iron transport system substrate-binding protein
MNFKKRRTMFLKKIFPILILLFLCQGCANEYRQTRHANQQEWLTNNGKLKILSTTGIINDAVQQIGGEYVDTTALIQGDLDPHSYQLVKGDDEKLAYAQIIFSNGLGLEHGPSLHRFLHENPKNVSLGDRIQQAEPEQIVYVRGETDPHIWMDISLWAKIVPILVEEMSKHDPQHAEIFQKNGEKLMQDMQRTHEDVKEIIHQIPSDHRYLVTSHDAFNYFARAYFSDKDEITSGEWQKRFAAPEGLAPESQLSATDIRSIIRHLMQHQIHIIFPESNVSRDSIRKIVQAGNEQGLALHIACCPLYGDAMGPPGSEGDSYLKMIVYNAKTLMTHLDAVVQNRFSQSKNIHEPD